MEGETYGGDEESQPEDVGRETFQDPRGRVRLASTFLSSPDFSPVIYWTTNVPKSCHIHE